jgi:hypothetical protein
MFKILLRGTVSEPQVRFPPYLDLPWDDPVEVDRRRGRRTALTLGQPLLLRLPLLEAAGDVDGDATATKVSPADVAGDGHDDADT